MILRYCCVHDNNKSWQVSIVVSACIFCTSINSNGYVYFSTIFFMPVSSILSHSFHAQFLAFANEELLIKHNHVNGLALSSRDQGSAFDTLKRQIGKSPRIRTNSKGASKATFLQAIENTMTALQTSLAPNHGVVVRTGGKNTFAPLIG